MKRLLVWTALILFFTTPLLAQAPADSSAKRTVMDRVSEYYSGSDNPKVRILPFGYYMNETGLMLGALSYWRNIYDTDAKMTNITLWAPFNETVVCYNNFEKIPIGSSRFVGGYANVIKFNDIRGHWIGNDSPDYERKYTWMAISPTDSVQVPINRGYEKYHGWFNQFGLTWEHKIWDYTYLGTGPSYQMLYTQVRDYQSDNWLFWWDERRMDSDVDPHEGWRGTFTLSKSLNLLSHDGFNDWDYYKVTSDVRGYIPVTPKSTLAIRGRVESAGGKNVMDESRSQAEQILTQNPNARIYTVAPFFDMALLGDTGIFKGYYYYRFFDNQSVLGQCEYRSRLTNMVETNLYVEAGRVMPYFSLKNVSQDYHFVYGGGLRLFFSKDIVARLDLGICDEGVQARANLGQTF